jgi:hypothetical protein
MYWLMNTVFIGVLVVFVGWLVAKSWQARHDEPKRDTFYDNDPNVG